LKDPDGFVPEWRILVAYIAPFAFGWLLYHSRDLLPRFERHVWIYLALAVPAFFLYGLTSPREHPYLKSAGNVLLCWLLIFVTLGLFLKYARRASARWRYMSDSSYWLYLMHMPVVVGLQVAFRPLPLPAIAKIPLVLGVSVVILVATYDLFVRATWIGALLNGRRYDRSMIRNRRYSCVPA
jgi:glucans biosynthesis protein C